MEAPVKVQNLAAELEREQAYVTMLYRRLDTLRERARTELDRALSLDGGGNVQARVDRDAFVARHSGRLAQLAAAEHGLCFGRLDLADGSHLYIGRLGLLDDDREPLLVDWRAPAAQPFYRATWAAPAGVVRRRHLRTRGRTVLGIEDDVLDPESLTEAERDGLTGEVQPAEAQAVLGRVQLGQAAAVPGHEGVPVDPGLDVAAAVVAQGPLQLGLGALAQGVQPPVQQRHVRLFLFQLSGEILHP